MRVSHFIFSLFLTTACATQSPTPQRALASTPEYAFNMDIAFLDIKIRGKRIKSKHPYLFAHLLKPKQKQVLLRKLRKKKDPCLQVIDKVMAGEKFPHIKSRFENLAKRSNTLHQKAASVSLENAGYSDIKPKDKMFSFGFNLKAKYINEYEHPSKPIESLDSVYLSAPIKDLMALRYSKEWPAKAIVKKHSRWEHKSYRDYLRKRYKKDGGQGTTKFQCNKDSSKKLERLLSYSADWLEEKVKFYERDFKKETDTFDSPEFQNRHQYKKEKEERDIEAQEYIESLK